MYRVGARLFGSKIDKILGLENSIKSESASRTPRAKVSRFSVKNVSLDDSMFANEPDPFLDAIKFAGRSYKRHGQKRHDTSNDSQADQTPEHIMQGSPDRVIPVTGFIDDFDDEDIVPHPHSFAVSSPPHLSYHHLKQSSVERNVLSNPVCLIDDFRKVVRSGSTNDIVASLETYATTGNLSASEASQLIWICASERIVVPPLAVRVFSEKLNSCIATLSNKELASVAYSTYRLSFPINRDAVKQECVRRASDFSIFEKQAINKVYPNLLP